MCCSDVNRSTRMVLTAARRSGNTKDLLPCLACDDFSFDDLELLVKAPECRYHEQFHTIIASLFGH